MKKYVRALVRGILPFYLVKMLDRFVSENNPFFITNKTWKYEPDSSLGKKVIKVIHKDYRFPLWLRKKTSDVYVYRAIFMEGEYNFSVKQEPAVIIDAGANIGLSAVYFANKYPHAKIIAIEPEEGNFKLLKKNTEQYPNVITIKAALWNTVGEIDLLDTGLGDWGYMVADHNEYKDIKMFNIENRHLTQTVTIDKIMKDYNIDEIDILKIDIEGAEKEVFSNADAWIGKVKSIIIELHERMKSGCNRVFYNNTKGFDSEWQRGEDVFLSKGSYIKNS